MLLAYKYVTATKSKYAENNGMSRTIGDPTDLVPRVASKFRFRRKKNNSLKYWRNFFFLSGDCVIFCARFEIE